MAKKIVLTDKAPAPVGPYSQAVVIDSLVYTAGQIPLTASGELVSDDVSDQTKQVLDNLKAVLEEAGSSLDKVIKTTVFLKDMNDFGTMNGIYATYFDEANAPARSAVEVARLPKDVLVEIEAVASV